MFLVPVRVPVEARRDVGQAVHERLGLGEGLVSTLGPQSREREQEPGEAGSPIAVVGREVGASIKGPLVGGQEHGQRPASALTHERDHLLVDRVDVGSLLPVDLDVDEVLVHQRGRARVLEGLVGHDVAPVTGAVAHRQKDRLVLGCGEREGPRAPGVPVDRVVRMLDQVGARGLGELVRSTRALGGLCVGHRHSVLAGAWGGVPVIPGVSASALT